MASRLDAELKHLFGERIVKKSIGMDYQAVLAEAATIPEITERLASYEGQPAEQREIIKALSDESAAALCYWLKAV